MSSLSFMQTRSFIDRLGDLDEEITKVCRAADVMVKEVGKEHADGVARLKEACKVLEDKQKYIRQAKDHLLGFDGFLHAFSSDLQGLMAHPESKLGGALHHVSEHMSQPMMAQVAAITEDTVECFRRVGGIVKDLREAKEHGKQEGNLKENVKALAKVCSAAENTIRKILTHSTSDKSGDTPIELVEDGEEIMVKKVAGENGFHGYNLTAGLPPEFLENIKKKKDEAKAKDDAEDEEGASVDKSAKRALPPAFLENIKKKKDEAKAKKDDSDDDTCADSKKAGFHGYQLHEDPGHGYKLYE